ncbi:MAG: TIR domain-containing protein [Planctomycetes bacterium]|nr:TIR domain-containing protein [Planctomycetota bacterium]
MPTIFMSYRRDDSAGIAGRIYECLQSHFGSDSVFMDVDTMPFGVDFRDHLNRAVGRCSVLLAIIGDRWLQVTDSAGRRLDDPEDFVRIEIKAALQRNIPVIPVLIGRVSMPSKEELPPSLAELSYRHACQVDPGRDFQNHIDRLIRGIERIPAQASSQPASDPENDAKVYGSFLSWPELFVGRDADMNRLTDQLGVLASASERAARCRRVIVKGVPGVGKSAILGRIAYDPEVRGVFPEVLTLVMGERPEPHDLLNMWWQRLNPGDTTRLSPAKAQQKIRDVLSERKMLMIIDDVWDMIHLNPFLRLNVPGCVTLISTRKDEIASGARNTPADEFQLPPLSPEGALELLQELAATAVENHPSKCEELLRAYGYLPLAIHVAGNYLQQWDELGRDLQDLLDDLLDPSWVVGKGIVPTGYAQTLGLENVTIAKSIARSVEKLDDEARRCLISLTERDVVGGLTIDGVARAWAKKLSVPKEEDEVWKMVKVLKNHGLLEVGHGKHGKAYRLHAIIVACVKAQYGDE